MAQEKRSMQGEFESHLAALIEKIGREIEVVKAEQEALRQRQEQLEHQWQSFTAELDGYWRLCEKQSETLRTLKGQLADFMRSSAQHLQSLRFFTEELKGYLPKEPKE